MWKWLTWVGLLALWVEAAWAGSAFVTFGSLKARPLAMGGAYVAQRDDLAAMWWNPGGFVAPEGASGKGDGVVLATPFPPPVALHDLASLRTD